MFFTYLVNFNYWIDNLTMLVVMTILAFAIVAGLKMDSYVELESILKDKFSKKKSITL